MIDSAAAPDARLATCRNRPFTAATQVWREQKMTEAIRYNRDPITEALLDIRIAPSVQVTQEGLLAALSPLSADYPESGQLLDFVSEFSIGAQVGASVRQAPVGIARLSTDKKQMLRAQPDGVTFNRLSPYPGWEAFRDEARRLWN